MRAKPFVLAGVVVAYAVGYAFALPVAGGVFGSLALVPVALAAWWFGLRGAIPTAVLVAAYDMVLPGVPGMPQVGVSTRGWLLGNAALLILALVLGALADALRRAHAERQRAEAAEARQRALLEASFDGVAVHEAGVLREVNEPFARMFGYAASEMKDMDLLELFRPEDRPGLRERMLVADAKVIDVKGLRRDRKPIDLELRDRPWTYEGRSARVVTLRDITEKRTYEQWLVESEARFRSLFENVAIGLYRTTVSGEIQLANPALAKILGYADVGELVDDRPDLRRSDPTSPGGWDRDVFLEALRAHGEIRGLETTLYGKGGVPMPVRESARAVLGDDGEVLYIEGTVEDLTAIRRLETERSAQAEVIARNERLAALGTLVAGVAHEINNPLMYVAGNVELAMLDLADLEKGEEPDIAATRRSLESALAGAERIAHITRALRAVARQGKGGQRVPVDLVTVARNLEALVRTVLPENVELRVEAPGGPVEISGDPSELHQVALNLVQNSIEALGSARGHVLVRVAREGEQATLEVVDDGPGVPEAIREKLFTPFFTTKANGAGLGLSIVHGIVKDHGGEVFVRSAPRTGAVFSVRLPVMLRLSRTEVVSP